MKKRIINKVMAKKMAIKYKINLDIIPIDYFCKALNVELEHGSRFGVLTNVSDNDIDTTTKIVIAHLMEIPDYYQRLEKMEARADIYWKNKNKNIFVD